LAQSAVAFAWLDRPESVIERAQQSLRLSPLVQSSGSCYNAITVAKLRLGAYEEAVDAARQDIRIRPQYSFARIYLAAALIALGRRDEAREAVSRALTIDPGFSLGKFVRNLKASENDRAAFTAALSGLGLPE